MSTEDTKSLWRWISSGAFLASMCCFPSVLLAGLGLMSVAAADQLSNDLYFGPARWILYLATILLLGVGLYRYFQEQGICDLDSAKRERKRIINTSLLVFFVTVVIYIIFNYIILELLGIAVGLPWEEDALWN